MPHDAVIEKQQVVLKDGHGRHDRIMVTAYEAPADGQGGVAADPFKGQDEAIARTMRAWLEKHYPGHFWGCVSDLRHGIVKFNIPVLMGFNDWWIVNLKTHDIIDGMRLGAGEILERYGLSRGRFQLDQFLDARAKHSKLVLPSRKIPE